MAQLDAVLDYILQDDRAEELSEARLIKIIYIADWKAAIERGCQLTPAVWKFESCGPCSEEVSQALDNIKKVRSESAGAQIKASRPSLNKDDKAVLDFAIEKVVGRSWTDLNRLVYSTFPILTQPRNAVLKLGDLAESYKKHMYLFE